MLVHIVLFWLKKDLSKDDLIIFKKEVSLLGKISSVEHLYLGQPAGTTKRPVIDDSYDFCLTVVLKDIAAHDAYQEDTIHLEFIKNCSHMWEKVKIYDAE